MRVYRRGKADSKELVGLVEPVGDEPHLAFKTLDELVEILSSPGTESPKRKKRRRGREAGPPRRSPEELR